MRPSAILLIFFFILNAWAGVLQQYDVDDHMEINIETGDPEELEDDSETINATKSISTGDETGGTLLGMYNAIKTAVQGMYVGLQPGLQMLMNITPPGPARTFVGMFYGAMQLIMGIDIAAWLRGVDL